MQEYLLDVIIILLLIIVNGILAMTELAIVSSNRSKMEAFAEKNAAAKIALGLMNNPGSFLSTIQIGITIIGIIAGAFSGQKFAEPLGLWLNHIPWVHHQGNLIAYGLVVVCITYFSIVLGELIPKHIAISKPEKIAILFAKPIHILSKITQPFVVILDLSTKALLKMIKHKTKATTVTEEEIHSMMKQGLEEGTIGPFEHRVFQKVMEFGEQEASVMMTPRIKVAYLDLKDTIETNIQKMIEDPHRYYPVCEGGIDNFRGIIDTKDALIQKLQHKTLNLKSLIKEAPCVIEGNLGPDLLEQFKQYHTHIIVVIDEYGTMQGIVTLVDLFESLIGNTSKISSEKQYEITPREDGSWLCDGLTPIDKIEELLATEIVNNDAGDFNTLAGFLLTRFEYIPRAGEYILWEGFKFEIVDMDGTRIDKVLIQKINTNL